jgi:hypothetical protein
MPGTKLAPTASRANFKKHTSIVATGGATIRHSLRDGFNGFLRALPGDRAFCRRRCADRSAQLSISVEMPKPHDFAVRKRHIRLMHLTSIASRLTFRDDSAYAPLAEAGWAESIKLFLPRSEAKNFSSRAGQACEALRTRELICPSGNADYDRRPGTMRFQCSPGQIGALSRRAGGVGRDRLVTARLLSLATGHQLPDGRRSASLPPTRDGSLPPMP